MKNNPPEAINRDIEKTVTPTWLKVKSRLKGGSEPEPPKAAEEGPGEIHGDSPALAKLASRSRPLPTWLKVKSQVRAGGKEFDFGPGDSERGTTPAAPTWLKVKSQIKAGDAEPPKHGEGPGEVDDHSPALARLISRTTTT